MAPDADEHCLGRIVSVGTLASLEPWLATSAVTIDRSLQDLWVFVPFWIENIERRRALMLSKVMAQSNAL